MSDSIHLGPLGDVKKEYALVGGAVLTVMVVVYYRKKKQTDAIASAGANTGIDPATGYPYGSPEDAAALANQDAYVSPNPSVAPTGGGSDSSGSPGRFTSNAQWSQYVISYMQANQLVQDIGPLSAAIGRYLAGQPVSDDDKSLIQQAISVGGLPPVAGASGFPPSINTSPAPPTPTPTGPLPAPSGLHWTFGKFAVHRDGSLDPTTGYIDVSWGPVPGAKSYQYSEHSAYGSQQHEIHPETGLWIHENVGRADTDHFIEVRARDANGKLGDAATGVAHTPIVHIP